MRVAGIDVSPDCYIGGKRVSGPDAIDVISPIDCSGIGQINGADEDLVDAAVHAAADAFPHWAGLGPVQRGKILHRYADLINENVEALSKVETRDNGSLFKVVSEKLIPRSAVNFTFFADWANKIQGRVADGGVNKDHVLYQPSGVSALVTPWNTPFMLTTWKMGPALAAGNTIVIKPPELAPLTCSMLMDLATRAGFPDGVINLVQGDGPGAGNALVSHPGISRISFTGSPDTARSIGRAAAENLTPVSFELGGKSPFIVFASADLERAAATVMQQYNNAGQVCLAGTRLLVESGIAEEFMQLVQTKAASLKVGDPMQPDTNVGPLISRRQFERVKGFVDRSVEHGAKPLYGGHKHDFGELYFEPTIMCNVTTDMEIAQKEVFGPVLTWMTFDDEDEAIDIANDTEYGLAATLFTGDRDQALRIGKAVVAGTVWVNSFYLRNLAAPFGGARTSGVGREGGDWSFDFFCDVKNLSINEGSF